MGLIAARPEDPEEWAGIPSEPLESEARVDRLDEVPVAATDAFGLLGGGETVSISLPASILIPVMAEVDPPQGDGEQPRS